MYKTKNSFIALITLFTFFVQFIPLYAAWSLYTPTFTIKNISKGTSASTSPSQWNPWDIHQLKFTSFNMWDEAINNVTANFSFSSNNFEYISSKVSWILLDSSDFNPPIDNIAPISNSLSIYTAWEITEFNIKSNIYKLDITWVMKWDWVSDSTQVSRTIYTNIKPHITDYFFTKDWTTTTSTIQWSQNESVDLVIKVKDYNWCTNIDNWTVTADLSLLWLWVSESLTYDSCEWDWLTAIFKKTWISTLANVWDKVFSYTDFSATDEDGNTIDPNDANTTFDDEDKKTNLTISVVAADAPSVTNEWLTDDYIGWMWETSTDISFSATQDWDSKVAIGSCEWTIIQDWTTYTNWDTDTVTINSASLSELSNTIFVCVKNWDWNIWSFNFNITKDTSNPIASISSYDWNVLLDDADITFQCNENWQYKIDRITPSLLEVVSYTNINKDTNTTATILNWDTQLWSNTFRITCKDNAWNTWVSSDITITKQEPTPSMDGQITLFEDPDSDLDGIDWRDIHLTWNTAIWTWFSWFQSWRIYLLPSNVTLNTNTHNYIRLINDSATWEFTWESTLTKDSAWNNITSWEYKAYVAIMWSSGMLWEAWVSSAVTLVSDVVEHATVTSARFTSDTNLELTTDSTLDTNTANHDATKITYQIDWVTKTWVSIASINGQKINITIPSIWATDKTWTNLSIEADAIRSAIWWYNYAQTPAITINDAISPSFVADLSKSTAATYSNFYDTSIDFSWNLSEQTNWWWATYIEFIRTWWNNHVWTNNKVQLSSVSDLASWAHTKTINLNQDDTENVVLTCGTTYKVKMTAEDLAWNATTSWEITNISFDNCAPTIPIQTIKTLESTLTPTLSWNASTDDSWNGSWINNYTLEVFSWNWCSWTAIQTKTTSSTSQVLDNLWSDQADYSWKIKTTDNVWNISDFSACDDFRVDTSVPAFTNWQINDTTIWSTSYITQDDTIVITIDITNTDIDHIRANLASITWNSAHTNVACNDTYPIDNITSCSFVWTTATYTLTSWAAITDTNKQISITAQNTSGWNEQTTYLNITADSTNPTIAADTISDPVSWTIGWDSYDIVFDASKISDTNWIDHIEIDYSTDWTNWTNIYNWPKTSPYTWDISWLATANDYRLKLKAQDTVWNTSEQTFGLFNVDRTAPVVAADTINYPNGWEIIWWTINITWDNTKITDSSLAANPIKLEYSTDLTNWTLIAENEANDWAYSWTTPEINNSNVTIKLTATDTVWNSTSDTSDAVFTIDSVDPNLTLTYGTTVPHWNKINNSWIDISATTSDANMNNTSYRFKNTTTWEYWNGTDTYTTDTWVEICAIWAWANTDCDNLSTTINPTIVEWNTYRLEVKSVNKAWNENISTPLDYTWDLTDPTIAISTDNDKYFKDTISLAWTSSDAWAGISSVKLQIQNPSNQYWNGTSFQVDSYTISTTTADSYANWSYDFTPWAGTNEVYSVTAIAYDRAYKTYNSSQTSINIKQDTVNPVITWGVDLLNFNTWDILWWGDTKTITWTPWNITDADSGLTATPISLEYFDWTDWISIATNEANDWSYDWTIPSIDLSDAKIRIIATDNVLNTASQESNTFTIDSTAPTISFTDTNTPDDNSYINNNSWIDITWSASDVLLDKVYYKFVNDLATDEFWDGWAYTTTETWVEICSDATTNWTSINCNNLSFNISPTIADSGVYKLYLKATDELGNETITISPRNYIWDITAPIVNITNTDWEYFKNSITISWTSSDNLSWVTSVNIQIKDPSNNYWDGSNFVAWEQTLNTSWTTANWTYDFSPAWTNEAYTVTVIATDDSYKVANTSNSTITVNQDTISPSIWANIFTNPSLWDYLEWGSSENITWTNWSITDAGSDLKDVNPIKLELCNGWSCSLITDIDNTTGSYSWIVPTEDDNGFYIRLTATDNVGNTSIQNSWTFTIDSTAPTIDSVETMDKDANWQIDALKVTMSENIDDSSINIANFSISDSIWTPTWKFTWDVTNDNVFELTFTNTWDTSTTPSLTYTAWSLTDLAGKSLAWTTKSSTDKAVPRLLSSSIFDNWWANWKLDTIVATFSETISSTTDTTAWTINNLLAWASIASVSTSWDTATITLNESTDFDTSVWTMDLTFTANSNWKDSTNNQAWSKNNLTISDEAKPVILSSEYTDNNSNYIVDKVTITLSENVTWFDIADYTLTGLTKNTWSVTNNIVTLDITEAWASDSWVTASFDYTNNSNLKDSSNNTVNSVTWFSITDKVSPKLLSKETIDSDSNWQIDKVRLTFSEDIWTDFSSFVAEVDGYNLDTTPYTKNSATIVDIAVQEKTTPDTWATPQFRINSNSSLKDMAWNLVETTTLANLTDKVWPVITWARFDEGANTLYLTFSESIDNNDFTTWNLALNNAWWTVSVVSVDSWNYSAVITNESIVYGTSEISFATDSVWDTSWNKQQALNYAKISASIIINEYLNNWDIEYIELKNISSSDVDISGWIIENALWVWSHFTIPALTTITAWWYYLVATTNTWLSWITADDTAVLNMSSDIVLKNWAITVDSASYQICSNNKSYERVSSIWDGLTDSNWYIAQTSNWFTNTAILWTPKSDNVFDATAPTISSYFPSDNTLLPMWSFDLSFDYADDAQGLWVDITTDSLSLFKFDWAWFNTNVTASVDSWNKTITTTKATYPVNNLDYGKYQATFTIDDNAWNTVTKTVIFYVDALEFTIDNNSLNLWELAIWDDNISTNEITITVKTVWAWFNLTMDKSWLLSTWWIDIIDYNSTNWFGFDIYKNENWTTSNYSNSLSAVNSNTIWNIAWTINTSWEKNTYIYKLKYWANIDNLQAAWVYNTDINFNIWLNY